MPDYSRQSVEPQLVPTNGACLGPAVGGSNAAAQERLAASHGVDPVTDCDERDDLAEALTRDAFQASTFEEKNVRPSSGFGRFDAAFDPQAGSLDITLKLAFDFTLHEGADWAERMRAAWNGEEGWTAEAKATFIKQYREVVESTWSAAHIIRCVRPGWEDVAASPTCTSWSSTLQAKIHITR